MKGLGFRVLGDCYKDLMMDAIRGLQRVLSGSLNPSPDMGASRVLYWYQVLAVLGLFHGLGLWV